MSFKLFYYENSITTSIWDFNSSLTDSLVKMKILDDEASKSEIVEKMFESDIVLTASFLRPKNE